METSCYFCDFWEIWGLLQGLLYLAFYTEAMHAIFDSVFLVAMKNTIYLCNFCQIGDFLEVHLSLLSL